MTKWGSFSLLLYLSPSGTPARPAPLYVLTPGLCPHWLHFPKWVRHRTHARPAHPRRPHPPRPSRRTQVGPSLSSPSPTAASAGVHSPNATGRTQGAAPLVSRPRPRPWHGSIQPMPEATASARAPLAQSPFTERGPRLARLPAPLIAVPLVRSRARGGRRANIPASSGRCARTAGRRRPVGRAVGLALVPRAGPVRHAPLPLPSPYPPRHRGQRRLPHRLKYLHAHPRRGGGCRRRPHCHRRRWREGHGCPYRPHAPRRRWRRPVRPWRGQPVPTLTGWVRGDGDGQWGCDGTPRAGRGGHPRRRRGRPYVGKGGIDHFCADAQVFFESRQGAHACRRAAARVGFSGNGRLHDECRAAPRASRNDDPNNPCTKMRQQSGPPCTLVDGNGKPTCVGFQSLRV